MAKALASIASVTKELGSEFVLTDKSLARESMHAMRSLIPKGHNYYTHKTFELVLESETTN